MEQAPAKSLQQTIEAMKVLVVDDEQYMRKVVRTMLLAIGVKTVYEAEDGNSGLDAIRRHMPDLVIVDWEMPVIDGAQFVRMVRSPDEFPYPEVPIIMLSGHGDRWRVVEAANLGAHEYLLKPVSTRALHERIAAILTVPRPFITLDNYYGPAPRRMMATDARGRPVARPQAVHDGRVRPAARPETLALAPQHVVAPADAGRPVAASRNNPVRPASPQVVAKADAITEEENVVLL
jgi:two-component system chemotaxis response regulator CheY